MMMVGIEGVALGGDFILARVKEMRISFTLAR
jgi:hypothetical protein